MKSRFRDGVWVTLKPNIWNDADSGLIPGQVMNIICDVNAAIARPPLYRCEWSVAGKKFTRLFSEDQLQSWPGYRASVL